MIAAAVKHMLAAGMSHEAIVAAVEEMEASMTSEPVRTKRQERNRRYYEKRLNASEKRLNASETSYSDADPSPSPASNKENPQTPKEINSTHTHTPAKSAPTRGTRLAADWVLPVSWGQWAISQGHSEATIRREADKFADFWHSKAGRDALKLDWQATWRNWMRNAPAVGRDALARDGPPRKKNIVDVIDELQEKANGRNSDHTFAAFGNVIDITGSSSDGRGIAPAFRSPPSSAGDRW